MFDRVQRLVERRVNVSMKAISNRYWMHNDLASWIRGGPLLGSRSSNKRYSFHQRQDSIIRPSDHTFRKDDQGALRLLQYLDARLQSLSIQAFAIDAEGPDSAEHKTLKSALLEQVPAGHCVGRDAGTPTQFGNDRWIRGSAVVRREQHRMPSGNRFPQSIDTLEVKFLDPIAAAQSP
jgi:hypothetical protein